jgi:hypothetical protein
VEIRCQRHLQANEGPDHGRGQSGDEKELIGSPEYPLPYQ